MFTKEMFESIPKHKDLKYSYKYDLDNNSWDVVEDGGVIASVSNKDPDSFTCSSGVITIDMDILQDFRKFIQRPEYNMIQRIQDIHDIHNNVQFFQEIYEDMFVGSVFMRAANHKVGCDPDDAWPQIDKALNWLRSTDFFKAPASSVYHDSYEGGLCYHSLKVVKCTFELMQCNKFKDSSKLGDAIFCALVHDWCKINLYESYLKNVKNENTNVWEKVQAYRYTGNAVINLGHGVSSMFLINKFFNLNVEEASAIRWHMGSYRTSDAEFDELQSCNENFMLVHLIQFADQLSLVKY